MFLHSMKLVSYLARLEWACQMHLYAKVVYEIRSIYPFFVLFVGVF